MRGWIIVGIGLAAIVTVLFLPPLPPAPGHSDVTAGAPAPPPPPRHPQRSQRPLQRAVRSRGCSRPGVRTAASGARGADGAPDPLRRGRADRIPPRLLPPRAPR